MITDIWLIFTEPTTVDVQMYFNSFGSLSAANMVSWHLVQVMQTSWFLDMRVSKYSDSNVNLIRTL